MNNLSLPPELKQKRIDDLDERWNKVQEEKSKILTPVQQQSAPKREPSLIQKASEDVKKENNIPSILPGIEVNNKRSNISPLNMQVPVNRNVILTEPMSKIQEEGVETRASRVSAATNASLSQVARNAPSPSIKEFAAPTNLNNNQDKPSSAEKVDLTVNVYVGDKKHTSQQSVQLNGGIHSNVNGM